MDQIKKRPLPVKFSDRIVGYDIARGIAVLLMLIINFKCVLSLNQANAEWISDVIDFFDRRAAVVLVMVSGIGLTLFTRNTDTIGNVYLRSGSRNALVDRALFLFISGYVLSMIWSADILHFYAIFIFIGVFLSARSNPFLLSAAALFWAVSTIQFFEVYDILQDDLYFSFLLTHLINLFFTGYYPVFPWAAFFIFGMFLGRLDFQDKGLRRKILSIGLVLLAGSEFASRLVIRLSDLIYSDSSVQFYTTMGVVHILRWVMEIDLTIPTPFSVISGIGSGLIILMIGVSLSEAQQQKWIKYLIIGGRNTLTLYLGHIVFLIPAGVIFNLSNAREGVILLGAGLFFVIFVTCMSLWLKKYNKGPVETLMRRFSLRNRYKIT